MPIKTPQQFVDEEGRPSFTCYICGESFANDPTFDGQTELRQHTVQTDPQSVCDDCYQNRVVPWLKKNGWKVP